MKKNIVYLDDETFEKSVSEGITLVDFYADWCESCVAMEKNVFSQLAVREAIRPFTQIRVDLSENSIEDTAIMKQFNVLGFPTILLINPETQTIITQWGPELYDKPVEQFISELGSVAASKG